MELTAEWRWREKLIKLKYRWIEITSQLVNERQRLKKRKEQCFGDLIDDIRQSNIQVIRVLENREERKNEAKHL